MKTNRLFLVLMILIVAFAAQGCTENEVLVNGYKTLKISEKTHEALIGSANDAYHKKLINFDQRKKIEDCDRIFQASFNIAKKALISYKEYSEEDGKNPEKELTLKEDINFALAELASNMASMQKSYFEITKGIEGVKKWKQQ